jgi:methylornithine synthase
MKKELETILDDAVEERCLDRDTVSLLLSLREPGDIESLFRAARSARQARHGNRVYVYGFVYFSNHCRNSCAFCGCRASSSDAERYRKSAEEVVSLSTGLMDEGVHLVDLTMGEDPYFLGNRGEKLLDVVSDVRDAAPRGCLMVSPGVVPPELLTSMREAGADWYACYQETYNPMLYGLLRPGQDFGRRMAAKLHAKRCGLLIEEGMMVGVGETLADRVGSIMAMGTLGAQQVRAMTFVPPNGVCDSIMDELKAIAVMRLAYPDRLIPASLDVQGLEGLAPRLAAGANVVTSVIPPGSGLKGVANPTLGIDADQRSPSAVRQELDRLGYRWAGRADYDEHILSARGAA